MTVGLYLQISSMVKTSFLSPCFGFNTSDSKVGIKSVGKTTANQRNEACFGMFKTPRWMHKLKDFFNSGKFNALNPVYVEYLRFCLTNVFQAKLDHMAY